MLSKEKIKKFVDDIRVQTKTFQLLAPTNLESEREKFFKDDHYNPRFEYPKFDKEKFRKTLKLLKNASLNTNDPFEKYLWERRINETRLKTKLMLSIGSPEKITEISEALYQCKFGKKYIQKAKKDSRIKKEFVKYEEKSARQTAGIIKKYLQRYGASYWQVHTHKNADYYVQIRYKKELISINEDINWDFNSMDSLLAHEIDGHVVRALNALRQKDELLQNPLPFYIKTEEGLASYLGDYHAENGEVSRKHHAIKYLAGFFALNNNFRELYNFLLDNGFSEELAFQRAFRLKRGFTKTDKPGVFAREAVYYEGMLDVKEYLDNKGDLEKLYAGKIGLEDIPLIEDISYIKPPAKQIIPNRIKST